MSGAGMLLTPDEIHEITDREQPAAQISWLRDNGWKYEVGRSGRPKVAREYYRARMISDDATTATEPQRVGPDLAALDAAQARH